MTYAEVQARAPAQTAPRLESRTDNPGGVPVDNPGRTAIHDRTNPLPHLMKVHPSNLLAGDPGPNADRAWAYGGAAAV